MYLDIPITNYTEMPMFVRCVISFSLLILLLFNSLSLIASNKDLILTKAEAEIYIQKMGDELWTLREIDSKKAIEMGLKAIEMAEDYNLDSQIARISNFLGVIYSLFIRY